MDIEELKSMPQATIPKGEEEIGHSTQGFWYPYYGHGPLTMTARQKKVWQDTSDRQMVLDPGEVHQTWGDVAHDFCQNTSIHGLKPIEEPQPFVFRRLIWACLVAAGTVIFMMEMLRSVKYFSQYPVSVDVKINYNRTVHFPAVTLCNTNAFRITVAAKMGWYDVISNMFGQRATTPDQYNASNLSLMDLFYKTAHKKEDLILGCKWAQDTCSAEDFDVTLTDFGVCYTFNSGRNKTIRKITQSGTNGGLRLHLNIEQYEYMQGPNEAAGLRVLLHNQQDVALVKDLGAAVPPGTHGYLGVQIVQVHNLEFPHGQCNKDKQVALYDIYSMPNCVEDCKTTYIVRVCGCKDIYMPGDVPVCSLSEYQNCLAPELDNFNVKDHCDCPIPCRRILFEPVITYATTSNFDLFKILHSDYIPQIQTRFITARETIERVDQRHAAENAFNIWQFHNVTRNLEKALGNVVPSIENGSRLTEGYMKHMQHRIDFHMLMMGKVYYMTKFNFERGWDIREERTILYVASAYLEVIDMMENVAMTIVSTPENMTETRLATWLMAELALKGKHFYAQMAIDNITQVHQSYLNATPLLTYKASKTRIYDMTWVCPELFYAVNVRQGEYFNALVFHIQQIKDSIDTMLGLKESLLFNNTFNRTKFEFTAYKFKKGARSFYYRLSQFKERVVLGPLAMIQKELNNFEQDNKTLHSYINKLQLLFSEVKTLSQAISQPWQHIKEVSGKLRAYLEEQTLLKTPLCHMLVSREMQKEVQALKTLFSDLRSRGRDLIDGWRRIENEYYHIWGKMLSGVCTKPFYTKVHEDITSLLETSGEERKNIYIKGFSDLLRWDLAKTETYNLSDFYYLLNADFASLNSSYLYEEIERSFNEYISATDIASILGDTDIQLEKVYETMKKQATQFLKGNEVNFQFYRENFLRLDIFMRELSYEEIIQEEAYSLTQLLCDVGGSLGLFIGASVLSLFEIFDAIIHHCCKKLIFKRNGKAAEEEENKDEKPVVKYMWSSKRKE